MSKTEQITHLLQTTNLTNIQIRETVGCRGQLVSDTLKSLGTTYAKDRKRRMYSMSKLGKNNPMTGKTGEAHHNYIGLVEDNKGYLMVLKPDWYTGRKGSKHIFEHTEVYCMNAGLTQVEKGYCIHHCDQDKMNNKFENLVMLTLAEHRTLHTLIKGATTISKESTLKWVEARRDRLRSVI